MECFDADSDSLSITPETTPWLPGKLWRKTTLRMIRLIISLISLLSSILSLGMGMVQAWDMTIRLLSTPLQLVLPSSPQTLAPSKVQWESLAVCLRTLVSSPPYSVRRALQRALCQNCTCEADPSSRGALGQSYSSQSPLEWMRRKENG